MGEGGGGRGRSSALSLFRFHLSPFPQKRLILRLGRPVTQSIQFQQPEIMPSPSMFLRFFIFVFSFLFFSFHFFCSGMLIQYFSGNVPRTNAHLVCYTAVLSVVTQRSCVTTIKTAVQQTNTHPVDQNELVISCFRCRHATLPLP